MTTDNARDVVDRYFAAQVRKDFDAMRPLLHDDVTFVGALGTSDTAEAYIEGLKRLTTSMAGMERRVVIIEGDEVCQIYDLALAEPEVTLPVAQWITVRDGRIAALRVFFDPRPLTQSTS